MRENDDVRSVWHCIEEQENPLMASPYSKAAGVEDSRLISARLLWSGSTHANECSLCNVYSVLEGEWIKCSFPRFRHTLADLDAGDWKNETMLLPFFYRVL